MAIQDAWQSPACYISHILHAISICNSKLIAHVIKCNLFATESICGLINNLWYILIYTYNKQFYNGCLHLINNKYTVEMHLASWSTTTSFTLQLAIMYTTLILHGFAAFYFHMPSQIKMEKQSGSDSYASLLVLFASNIQSLLLISIKSTNTTHSF